MAAVSENSTVQQKLRATCPTHSRSDISARDVESVIDEPKDRGGTNLGLSPTETLVAALIGCTNVIGNKTAHNHGIELRDVSIDADATFDRRGSSLREEIDVPFPKIVLTINVTTPATAAEIEKVKTELAMYCPISKVIRQAGTEIEENWNVNHV